MDAKSPFFYLGKVFDPASGKLGDQQILYDPANLTTHAIVTGMTGSGKTGLCIGMLEEAALKGIPALVIDPKGDLTNLLLHFPDLLPQDFEPWLDPEAARRDGKSIPQMAQETSERWKKGLADWGLGHEDLLALQQAADFAVYTPGSNSGLPVNILASFQAPDLPWEENREVLREKIASIVTALLSLVGLTDIDPLRSREHILLCNILEYSWSGKGGGHPLDMTELILQTQTPPFERLGAFPVATFFPDKDRFELAMLLNNFLAAPSFQTWLEGQPLDIPALLFTPQGKPRHSIFYLAHLSENERMFFVTLLFAAVESWMRSQRGTSGLRALLYFDEIMGYLPPVANPPSRTIMLRMLKQARAFGVGLLLATQNPVDVDYKALSNAGTWIIGRLQTERDKQRLLDGLQTAGGSVDLGTFDQLISSLGKRVFLLHNVNQSGGPRIFQTRWALNFLAGPLMRAQIPALNQLSGQTAIAAAPAAAPAPVTAVSAAPVTPPAAAEPRTTPAAKSTPNGVTNGSTSTRPALPAGVNEYFLPNDLNVSEAIQQARLGGQGRLEPQGFLYRPALFAQAEVRFVERRYALDYAFKLACMLDELSSNLIRWEDFAWNVYDARAMSSQALPAARFMALPIWLSETRRLQDMQKDYVDWVYRSSTVKVRANETLKVYAAPSVSSGEFRDLCSQAAREAMQAEQEKLSRTYDQKLRTLEQKVEKQRLETQNQADEVSQRRTETLASGGELLLGLLGGRKRRLSSTISKNRLTQEAQANLEEERQQLAALEKNLADLKKEREEALTALQKSWAGKVDDVTEVPLTLQKKNIFVELFGVVWRPFYLFPVNGQTVEVPAFRPAQR